jgi:hypothetical protein
MALEHEIVALTESLCLAHIHHQAQENVIEAAHVQLIVQNMYAMKLNEALNVKEKEKEKEQEDDCTKLCPDGKGRYLTDEGFIVQKKQIVKDKLEKATACTRTEGLICKKELKRSIGVLVEESEGRA